MTVSGRFNQRHLVVAAIALGIVAVSFIASQFVRKEPATVQVTEADAVVYFYADDITAFFDTDCVDVVWRVENIQSVELNGAGVVGEGEALSCVRTPTLEVTFVNDDSQIYRLQRQFASENLPLRLIIAGLLLSVATGVGYVLSKLFTRRSIVVTPARRSLITPSLLMVVVVILLIGTAIRATNVLNPLQWDESKTYLDYASQSLDIGLTHYTAPNNHLLNTLLMHFTTRMFGLSPLSMRLPAFWAGILLIAVTFAYARRAYGSTSGLIAAGLVAVASYQVLWSVNARGYSLAALLFVSLLLVATCLLRQRSLWLWFFFGLLMALTLYTMPSMVLGIPIVVLWVIWSILRVPDLPRRKRLLLSLVVSLLTGGVITLACYLPAYIFVQANPEALSSDMGYLESQSWSSFTRDLAHSVATLWASWNQDLPLIVQVLLVIGFGVASLFHLWVSRLRISFVAVALVMLPALLFIQLSAPFARTLAFLQPLYLVVASAGVVALFGLRSWERHRALIAVTSVTIPLWLGFLTLQNQSVYWSDETGRYIGAEEAVLAISSVREDGQLVICAGYCLPHAVYGLMYDVPLVITYGEPSAPEQPDDTFFLISIYETWLELPRALEFMGYSLDDADSATQIIAAVDTSAFWIFPETAP